MRPARCLEWSYFIRTQEAEREEGKGVWDQAIRPQTSSITVPPPTGSVMLSKSVTKRGPCVQSHEPTGDFILPNHSNTGPQENLTLSFTADDSITQYMATMPNQEQTFFFLMYESIIKKSINSPERYTQNTNKCLWSMLLLLDKAVSHLLYN